MGSAKHKTYDVVVVGGAIYGSAVAWWLTQMDGFEGRILVIERDPTYTNASTSHTNSCIRQQFSNRTNIQISRFGAEFIKSFRRYMGGDPEVPHLTLQSYGYMYLADTPEFAQTLKESQAIQMAEGAQTRHMTAAEVAADYPFYQLDDIIAANHNLVDEGYFDGGTMFDWFKRMARKNGVEYIHDEVTSMTLNPQGTAVDSVTLKSGDRIACGTVVNASGPRAVATARMAGLELPVRPRKRYTFIFDAAHPLDRDLPLTIDPSGVHMRSEGKYYLAGCPPDVDPDVEFDDFAFDHSLWQEKVWPIIATRVPAFEQVKVINEWVGHYAFNTFDQNAVVGPHSKVANFIFLNGFSGHGLQQSPALGRGAAELIAYGKYRSLDLGQFSYERIEKNHHFVEKAVI
ncbi:FAD dependent oxidoreductase [Sulfitobacter noctilucicola]|uniref:Glycine/D-amino acid oxidase-like deaminating enzyme n=1 Tax=Sulfitobacter noctilucicola TaxID=1342301 RepID=A0A7W6M959_9RHOB|nr:FAD-binding oxidoreductase [Sulfitobacter noctilucicola]KIN63771.1 FAD dependent oxidoreductase [Sulfitobacter noctilucicola]MBB4174720.1 glycine/D-amino acid oxidase-like deaminating enzyme [Sulfitobacter noctilucicola]